MSIARFSYNKKNKGQKFVRCIFIHRINFALNLKKKFFFSVFCFAPTKYNGKKNLYNVL